MTRFQQGAIASGIAIGIAFLLIRVSSARSIGDYVLAIGLTLIELAVVLYLERRAKQLEAEIESWRSIESTRQQLRGLAQAATDELRRRQEMVEAIDDTIETHIKNLDQDRGLCDIATLEKIAVNGIRAGYAAGIAHNTGSLRGSRPQEAA